MGVAEQQADHEPAVTMAATKANSILGCVNRGRTRDQGK